MQPFRQSIFEYPASSRRCVTNFQFYCPDWSSRTFENSRTLPAGPDQYWTPKLVAVKPSSLLSHLCYQAIETSYASCHAHIRHKTNALTQWVIKIQNKYTKLGFCHLGKLKTISNVGIYILSLRLYFIKSPVWQGKSPVTGHEPDRKKCLVCEPNLMFVTHLSRLA